MRIAHLYPDLLNLYGDRGNIMCLQYRCRQRGIQVTVDEISVGDPFDHTKYDLLFIGGGQDFEQEVLLEDLHRGKDEEIRRAVADGTVCWRSAAVTKCWASITRRIPASGWIISVRWISIPWAKKSGSSAITPLIRNSVE